MMGFDRKMRRKSAAHAAPTDAVGRERQRVRALWEGFERDVLPPDCSDVQRTEMRRAFYAGAFAIVGALTDAVSHEEEMTAGDEQLMIDLEIELQQYLINLGLGRA